MTNSHNQLPASISSESQCIYSISACSNLPRTSNNDLISYNEAISNVLFKSDKNELPSYQEVFRKNKILLENEQLNN